MLDAVSIGLRESVVSPDAHQVFRDLIDDLVATGTIDQPDQLELIRELASEDWLVANGGKVTAVYPFSLEPTGIQVTINGQTRYAMCAIDALGIAPMLSVPVEVDASCPETGERLHLSVAPESTISTSPDDVVIVRRRQGGSAHLSRCAATRFFASTDAADGWRTRDGDENDVILTPAEALAEATLIFGRCYTDGVRMVL